MIKLSTNICKEWCIFKKFFIFKQNDNCAIVVSSRFTARLFFWREMGKSDLLGIGENGSTIPFLILILFSVLTAFKLPFITIPMF